MKLKVPLTSLICFFAVLVLVKLHIPDEILAQASSIINATVRISVCGNGVKEGGEDCDGSDMNSQTCTTQGYAGGTLICDYSCSFDFYSCTTPTSTPSPIPTTQPTRSPTPAPTSSPTNTLNPTSTPSPTPGITPTPTAIVTASPVAATVSASPRPYNSPLPRTVAAPSPYSKITQPEQDSGKTGQISQLPLEFKLFDVDNSGKIERKEVYTSVKDWVSEWKKQQNPSLSQVIEPNTDLACDLNKDGVCTVKDFSLLMYHVDR